MACKACGGSGSPLVATVAMVEAAFKIATNIFQSVRAVSSTDTIASLVIIHATIQYVLEPYKMYRTLSARSLRVVYA